LFYLLLVSLIWSFSYGLIKEFLVGLDPAAVGVVRVGFSALVFLPFLRLRGLTLGQGWKLAGIGALQFGVLYIFYLPAYAYVAAHEVALFTIFTPLYVALTDAALERRWHHRYGAAALLAVAGAAVILWPGADKKVSDSVVTGFVLMQIGNLCFSVGQVLYRKLRPQLPPDAKDHALFGLPYLAALAVLGGYSLVSVNWVAFAPTPTQWLVLAHLGIVASGLGFFWWNLGGTRVNPGSLAAWNNAKVPLGVVVSLVFFHESANLPRLAVSLALLLAAIWFAERK
jgi:drug/metabolite transporter (DMT)-like permease